MNDNPLVIKASAELQKAGMQSTLMTSSYDEQNFGNAVALFETENLALKFYRDRGQDFLELALRSRQNRFYIFEHVALAAGFISIDALFGWTEPQSLADILVELKHHRKTVEDVIAFHSDWIEKAQLDVAARSGFLPAANGIH
ncbi:MAG: hypothetical protein ABSC92_07600 [Rhizomicrobium sp.]|jgi:hypothetical protein